MQEDVADRAAGAHGPNYARLTALKAKYDPGNRFRPRQNVRPSAAQRPPPDKGRRKDP
jgi:FAD/FMN-containing dehydrogenase